MKEEKFLSILKSSINLDKKEKYGIAFSGGLDSTVIAKLLLSLGYKLHGYVVGMKNSPDLIQAEKASKEIGLKLTKIELSPDEVDKAIKVERKILLSLYEKNKNKLLDVNAIPISYNLPLYFVAKQAKENKIILGQGPDEMLGGYKRHDKLSKQESIQEMKSSIHNFLEFGIKQNKANASYFKKEFIFPYLNEELINYSLSLPFESRIKKQILRDVAKSLGLSSNLSNHPKQAAQYGSRIMEAMRKLARIKKVHISRYLREGLSL
jgi:asparagine synthase (glutamine-hydrolysing)